MGKGKLEKFAQLDAMPHVVQPSKEEILGTFRLRGQWKSDFFKSDRPLVVELGCGRGEYTVALARREPDKSYLGIDIKGARIWKGAKEAQAEGLAQVGFLRTRIEWLEHAFAPGEIDELWITFPDPQLRWSKLKKRLTHPKFLRLYQQILKPGGKIHLKTDSPDLYVFTKQVVELYQLIVHADTADLYNSSILSPALQIKTHYESLDIAGSSRIHYLCFTLPEQIGNQDLDSLLKEKCRPDGAVD